MKHNVATGLDILVEEKFECLLGKRVAILANQASINKDIEHIVELAIKYGVEVVKLFAPEHGFLGVMQDMEHVGTSANDRLNIPVISLYGDHKESLKLEASHLKDVDVLLCDLQDIGSRYYTFHCTIAWAMAACGNSDTKLMVLDRPNPINSQNIEGNLVKKPHFSFVGAYPLPNRHGFSMGELVAYVKSYFSLDLDLEIIWMRDYERGLYFDDTSLFLVPPSPNMPSLDAMITYPGMCLIEGTNLSEGRGTCTPFLQVGAPFINAHAFKDKIDAFEFKGVKTRACSFKPKFQKHSNKECGGVYIHVTNRSEFYPLRFAIGMIKAAMEFEGFSWRTEAYEFEENKLAIDLLLGDEKIRTMLESRAPIDEIFSLFDKEEESFLEVRKDHLYYPDKSLAEIYF